MTRWSNVPVWAPIPLALVIGASIYGLWMRPTQAQIALTLEQLQQARRHVSSLQSQIQRDRALPSIPTPIAHAAFDRLWPVAIGSVQTAGYTFQGATFAAAPPLSMPISGRVPGGGGVAMDMNPTLTSRPDAVGISAAETVTPLELTAKFTGTYLALDDTLTQMRNALPLWSWRSIAISAQQGSGELTVTVVGVVAVEGRIGRTRDAATRRPIFAPPPPGGTP